MLTYDFENRGKMSLYEYLYKCIKDDILSGKIKAGEKLPSKREMAKKREKAFSINEKRGYPKKMKT